MRIYALWCHPRSVSTAFERIMRARGDLDVLHEPFMYDYYLTQRGRLFPGFAPEPGHPTSYRDIRAMIMAHAGERPVFFKDMAYYVLRDLPGDAEFMHALSHAFLIRDPAEAILSYHRLDPAFTCDELGHEAQFRLFDLLKGQGLDPLVLTADQLRREPERTLRRYWSHVGLTYLDHAFEWDDRVPEGWESVASWHAEVLETGAIAPPEPERDTAGELAALGAPFTDFDRHHRPFYEALRAVAEAQDRNWHRGPHQK
ncbi:MAG: hypothetical protein D6754_17005 [Alphaproteobacteria bacterium]|nr:MAG: hypothetical protein D6754_17005 [Alphaproteobacteria bacterium]